MFGIDVNIAVIMSVIPVSVSVLSDGPAAVLSTNFSCQLESWQKTSHDTQVNVLIHISCGTAVIEVDQIKTFT